MTDQFTFSLQEAADIAGIERDTLRQWLQRGHLNVERGAGQKRWTWAEAFYAATFAELAKGTKDYEFAKAVSGATFAHFRLFDVDMGKAVAVGVCVAYRDPESGETQVDRFTDLSLALQYLGELLSGVTLGGSSPAEVRIVNISEIKGQILTRLATVLNKRNEAKK